MYPHEMQLGKEYFPELRDYHNRHVSVSTNLYTHWSSLPSDIQKTLSFTEWTKQTTPAKPAVWERVEYVSPAHLNLYQVSFQNNKATTTYSGQLSCEKDMNGTRPIALIIMPNNNLYAISMNTRDETKIRVHHSSLSAGGSVFFAAEAFARDGSFYKITDRSGHYKPNLESFVYGLQRMKELGINLSNTKIVVDSWKDDDMEREYPNGEKFLNLYADHGFDDTVNFCGTYATLEEAKKYFAMDRENIDLPRIYFSTAENDLFELSYVNQKIRVESFTDKYKNKKHQLEESEDSIRGAPRRRFF